MILIEAGRNDERGFDAQIRFANQLHGLGFDVAVNMKSAPAELHRASRYEAVSVLSEVEPDEITRVIVIDGAGVGDACLERLRSYRLSPDVPVVAVAHFAGRQERISAQARLAYALGREPEMIDLGSIQPRPIHASALAPVFASPVRVPSSRAALKRMLLVIPPQMLETPEILPQLEAVSNLPGMEVAVLTAGFGKEQLRETAYASLAAYGYSEFSPQALAGMADIAVVYGPNMPGERMASFLLELMGRGGIVVDASEGGAIVGTGAPAVRGPVSLESLGGFLEKNVLPPWDMLSRETASHPWFAQNRIEALLPHLGLETPARDGRDGAADMRETPQVLFCPTNGIGLGHAQRCAMIASALQMPDRRTGFATFPSCISLVQGRGFDCLPLVSKSPYHQEPYANDLLNYLRLKQALGAGDTLVFDGGYVFSSIYRTIVEKGIRAIWIRRGLWQPGQIGQTPAEREAAFSRIIVPREAFDELNDPSAFGAGARGVGPVVQLDQLGASARTRLRRALKDRFGRPFKKLVVSMLGGGEAADRSAQLQAICAQAEAHADWLHLIVVWPNARVAPALHGWKNSHVVTTNRALKLAQAADLLVSAAGYNSFHEVLYHRIPAIFIPQMAPFMDDQERRAEAAAQRGAALSVGAEDMMQLQAAIEEILEGERAGELRAALESLDLPEPGNSEAARLIAEVSQHEQG